MVDGVAGAPGGSGGEDGGDGPAGRVAPVVGPEPPHEGPASVGVPGVGLLQFREGREQLLLRRGHRPGGLLLQVEVAAALGRVRLQVGGVQHDGPVEEGEVEHDGGVVGDQHIGEGEEFADIVVTRDVDDGSGRAERQPGGLQVVGPHEQGVGVAEPIGELPYVQQESGPALLAGAAPERRRVQHGLLVVVQPERPGERRARQPSFGLGPVALRDQGVVARVAGAQETFLGQPVGAGEGVHVVLGADEEVVEAVHRPLEPFAPGGVLEPYAGLVEAHPLVRGAVPGLEVRGVPGLVQLLREALVVDPVLGAGQRPQVAPGPAAYEAGVVRETGRGGVVGPGGVQFQALAADLLVQGARAVPVAGAHVAFEDDGTPAHGEPGEPGVVDGDLEAPGAVAVQALAQGADEELRLARGPEAGRVADQAVGGAGRAAAGGQPEREVVLERDVGLPGVPGEPPEPGPGGEPQGPIHLILRGEQIADGPGPVGAPRGHRQPRVPGGVAHAEGAQPA